MSVSGQDNPTPSGAHQTGETPTPPTRLARERIGGGRTVSHHGCHGKDHGVVGAYGPPSRLELCIGLSAEQGTGRQDSGQAYWTPEKHRRLGPRPAPQVIKLGTTWQQFGDILAGSTSGRFLPRESNCLQGKPITNQTWAGRANARFQRAERLSRWGDKGRDPAASRGSTASCM